MQALEVKVGDKIYHVEVPAPNAMPLEVIVDGLPFEVRVTGETAEKTAWTQPAKPETTTPDHTAVLTAITQVYRAKWSGYSRNGD
jgi:hypothetical protein